MMNRNYKIFFGIAIFLGCLLLAFRIDESGISWVWSSIIGAAVGIAVSFVVMTVLMKMSNENEKEEKLDLDVMKHHLIESYNDDEFV